MQLVLYAAAQKNRPQSAEKADCRCTCSRGVRSVGEHVETPRLRGCARQRHTGQGRRGGKLYLHAVPRMV